MLKRLGLAGALAVVLASTAFADPPPRVVVPISQHPASDAIFYSIPVLVDGIKVDAYIDTGSMGLRVAASALKGSDVATNGGKASEVYADGVTLSGRGVWAVASIGGLQASVPLEVVETISCAPQQPKCRARGKSTVASVFGGLKAVIGIDPAPLDVRIHELNPLEAVAASWIVVLPRPGAAQPGELILNPDADDLTGFTNFPSATEGAEGLARDNPLPGCLKNRDNGASYCGQIILDTGTSAILVADGKAKTRSFWPAGPLATLIFNRPDGGTLSHSFVIRPSAFSTRVVIGPFPEMHSYPAQVVAGVEPYLEYEVYYDPAHSIIGLKPRP